MAWRDVHRRWATTIVLTAALVLPSLWDVLTSTLESSGDIALIELRVREVLSAHPPWTGAYSRYGWDHPGPLFFWLAAIPYRALGGDARALALVALALNTTGIVVLLRLAARIGRAPWFAVSGALVALVIGLSPDALWSAWNVTITNVALLLFVVACWGVWCDVERAGGIALVAGSFVVQSHVGTGVVIAPLAIATLALVVWRWWTQDGHPPRALAGPGVIVGLLWIVPVGIDAIGDPPGNLARLLRWSVTHDEPQIGIDTAARLLGRTSSLTFVIEPRLERGVFLDIETVALGALPGIALLLLAAAWFVAWRAGWRQELVWCSIVGSLWASGLVAAASITLPLGWWLVQWLEPLGWMTWSAIVLVAWRLVSSRVRGRVDARVPIVVALGALLAGTVVHAVDVVRSHTDHTVQHATIRELADAVPAGVGEGRVSIATDGDALLADATLAGVVTALDRRGVDTCVDPRLVDKFRAHRVCGPDVGRRLLLRLERSTAPAPEGATTIVVVDPLGGEARAEIDRLTAELAEILRNDGREQDVPLLDTPLADVILLGEPSPELAARADDVGRLAELRSIPGDRYALYALP